MEISKFRVSTLLLVLPFLWMACNRSPHKIVIAEELDKYVVEHAENIYYELFKACEQDSLAAFIQHSYVSPKMHQQLSKGRYKNLCTLLKENVGEITSIEIQDAVYFKNILVAFRYKMKGTLIEDPIEFRLVLTIDNLVSSIGFYNWNEEYSYSTPVQTWAKRSKL